MAAHNRNKVTNCAYPSGKYLAAAISRNFHNQLDIFQIMVYRYVKLKHINP